MTEVDEKKDEKKYTTIKIPIPLAEKIKERIAGTGFNSISSYVTYVLRQVISGTKKKEEAFSEEEEEKVRERLRGLGYIK